MHKRRNSAFSLIELIMVLAVCALAAGIAAPRLANATARHQAQLSIRRVAADIALAQAQARATSKPQAISFSVANSTYELPNVTGLRGGVSQYIVSLRQEPFNALLVSVDFNGGASLTFDRYGSPSSGGTVTVRAGGTTTTLTVNAVTGKADVQ